MRGLFLALLGCSLFGQYLNVQWNPAEYVFEANQNIQFFAENGYDDTPLTFEWIVDGETFNGPNISIQFTESGAHAVAVFGWNGNSLFATWVTTFFVNPDQGSPNVSAFFAEGDGQLTLQAGSMVTLRAESNEPDTIFLWQIVGTGITFAGREWPFVAPDWDNVFADILLFGINKDGFVTPYPAVYNLYVWQSNPPPETTIVSPSVEPGSFLDVPLGETVTFQASASDPNHSGPFDFYWYISSPSGNDWEDGGSSIDVLFGEAGIYEIYATAYDPDEVGDPYPAQVAVRVLGENQDPMVWIEQGSETIPVGATIDRSAAGYDPDLDELTYHWDLGNGASMEGQTITFSYPNPGAYQLSCQASDARGGVSDVYRQWVFVNDVSDRQNQAPYAAFLAPAYESLQGFGTVSFRGEGFDPEGTATELYWDFDDGHLGQGATPTHTYQPLDGQDITLYPAVFARDASGLFSWYPDVISLGLYQGDPPPDGKIVSPIATPPDPYSPPRFVLKPGESLTLRGEAVGDASDLTGRWNLYSESGTELVFNGFSPDPIPFESFEEKGGYSVYFTVANDGKEDPIPASIDVWVRASNVAPEVWISEPGWDLPLEVGEGFDLAASGYDEDSDPITYSWVLSDGREFEGERIEYVKFNQAGLHWAELQAVDSEGLAAKIPVRRYFPVFSQEDFELEPPSIRPIAPAQNDLLGPPGSRFLFEAEFEDPAGIQQVFWDFGNGETSSEMQPSQVRYSQSGFYEVRLFAQNNLGIWTPWAAYWDVYIYGSNVPPEAKIESPPINVEEEEYRQFVHVTPIGEPVPLLGSGTDVDGDLPLWFEWWVDGEFYSNSLQPDALIFQERGFHDVALLCWDAQDLQDPFTPYREIQVIDPSLKPDSYIAYPYGDITVEPGEELYFFGYGEDPNGLPMTYEWTFSGGLPGVATGEEVFPVVFANESPDGEPFQVKMTAKTSFTEDPEPAVIRVTVKQYQDQDFEPNNSFEEAAILQQGRYSQLSLVGGSDDSDFFRFEVNNQGFDMFIQINTDQPSGILAELYGWSNEDWQLIQTEKRTAFHLTNLNIGTYILVVRLEEGFSKQKMTLSYGIGVATSQPSLYMPFLVEDGNLSSSLGIINPTDQPAEIAIIGLDGQGNTVESFNRTLAPHARLYAESLSFFGTENRTEKAKIIRWVKVLGPQRLIGYMTGKSRDGSQLVGIEGINNLSPSLNIPHIATQSQQWYTRAIAVNAAETSSEIQFRTGSQSQSLAGESKAGAQSDIRFSDHFETLPEWGALEHGKQEAALAGIELFGRLDGPEMLAGFDLTPTINSNPNFFYLEKEIIFAHVAKDTANFWTGISLVNLSQEPNPVVLTGYDDAGQVISSINLTLEPGQKRVDLVANLFPGVAGISWVRAKGNQSLAGFELFGDNQSTRIAGFQAPTRTTNHLIFPHVPFSDREWTGIALLNTGQTSANLTVRAYSDSGQLLEEQVEPQAAGTKLVRTIQNIFPGGLPQGTTYLDIKSDTMTLVGFELFGSLTENGLGPLMGGILALTP